MSWVAVAVVGGSVIAGGASVVGSRQAGKSAQGGADRATAESARQFDLIRGDTAGLRSIQGGALDTLASLYGWAPPSQAQYSDSARPLFQSQGGIPTVDAQRYQNDPAYRYAWDQTLAAERASPAWRNKGASTYYAQGTDADFARLTDSLTRGISEYQAAHPQDTTRPSGPNMDAFFESPDYQFNLEQGQQGIDRSLAARGRALSGAGVKEGTRFASGMASREYGSFVDRLLAAAGLGTTGVTTSANAGMTSAGQIGAAQQNAGNTRASAYMTGAEGVNNAVQGGISNWLMLQYLNKPPVAMSAGG